MVEQLGFAHFVASADVFARAILVVMLGASVGSWYLILVKGARVLRMRSRSARFLGGFWEARNLQDVAARIRENGTTEPFSHLLHHGFTAIEQIDRMKQGNDAGARLIDSGAPDEMLTRALKRSIEEDKTELEFGQTFLATVASAAPFVGLLGTVWGIYHALIAVGASGQTSLDKVAGPVGEALIMTGVGLSVAIPAAIAYNAFARANRNTLAQLNAFAYDVHTFLATGIKSSPMRSDARATSERVIALAQTLGTVEAARVSHPGLAVR